MRAIPKNRRHEVVAQSCTLLYRRLAVGWASESTEQSAPRKNQSCKRGTQFSLTPCFSWGFRDLRASELFQQFRRGEETVETVSTRPASLLTQLKQGVNERAAFLSRQVCGFFGLEIKSKPDCVLDFRNHARLEPPALVGQLVKADRSNRLDIGHALLLEPRHARQGHLVTRVAVLHRQRHTHNAKARGACASSRDMTTTGRTLPSKPKSTMNTSPTFGVIEFPPDSVAALHVHQFVGLIGRRGEG